MDNIAASAFSASSSMQKSFYSYNLIDLLLEPGVYQMRMRLRSNESPDWSEWGIEEFSISE